VEEKKNLKRFGTLGDWDWGLEVGTRGPTQSSDIQQKIVMMAIREESSNLGW
jgi:hypothetical protein